MIGIAANPTAIRLVIVTSKRNLNQRTKQEGTQQCEQRQYNLAR